MSKIHLKKLQERPLSWSSLSSWNYDKEAWAKKYLLGITEPPNAAMTAGKRIGELLATIPSFLPLVPRYGVFEKELKVKFGSIPLIGYLDSYDPDTNAFFEYKTYTKDGKWSQKIANAHGQIKMYKAMLYMLYDVPIDKIGCELVAIQVQESGDFKMSLAKTPIQIYEVKHTKMQVLDFLSSVQKQYKEMCAYALEFGK